MNTERVIILLIVLFILLGVLIFVLWYFQQERLLIETSLPITTPSVILSETPSPVSTPNETADWKTYTNTKYNYSFKYPPDYEYSPCTKKPCKNFVYDKIQGHEEYDYILLQGDISEKGWPNISVMHLDSLFYNPPAGTDLITWLKEKSPNSQYLPNSVNYELDGTYAVKVEVPASPQAYGLWVIYFIKDDKLFEIQLLDPATKEAKNFYNLFLKNFKVND